MVRTASTMLPLGTQLPDFELEMVSGLNLSYENSFRGVSHVKSFDLTKKPLFLMIICGSLMEARI